MSSSFKPKTANKWVKIRTIRDISELFDQPLAARRVFTALERESDGRIYFGKRYYYPNELYHHLLSHRKEEPFRVSTLEQYTKPYLFQKFKNVR